MIKVGIIIYRFKFIVIIVELVIGFIFFWGEWGRGNGEEVCLKY